MTQGVFMSVRQEVSFWVLEDFRNGKLSREEAALKLGISERSVSRKAKRLRESGLAGLTHGNINRTPKNRSSAELKQRVVSLLRDIYYDFNLTHARDKLIAEHGIKLSYGTLYAWAKQEGVGRNKKKRRTSKVCIPTKSSFRSGASRPSILANSAKSLFILLTSPIRTRCCLIDRQGRPRFAL